MKVIGNSRLYFIVALLSSLLVWVSANAFNRFLSEPLALSQPLELSVPKGSTLGLVARDLYGQQVLQHPSWWLLYARVNRRGRSIHAGDYLLEPGITPLDLLDTLERGKVRTYAVTLVEGWTLAQARAALARDPHLRQTLAGVGPEQLFAALNINDAPSPQPEGWFFPDTYVFSGEIEDRDILRQAYRRMQQVLALEWAQRSPQLPYRSAYEALIMASIVEKETGAAAERAEIGGVFVRRLQKSMLLQTDPAVIYGLGQDFDGNLRRSDLEDTANAFNTYARPGLPPTPIALPGAAAIRAALQPAAGDALYFVARGDGSHQFSATLDEHVQAVKKFQIQRRRSDYRSRPQ